MTSSDGAVAMVKRVRTRRGKKGGLPLPLPPTFETALLLAKAKHATTREEKLARVLHASFPSAFDPERRVSDSEDEEAWDHPLPKPAGLKQKHLNELLPKESWLQTVETQRIRVNRQRNLSGLHRQLADDGASEEEVDGSDAISMKEEAVASDDEEVEGDEGTAAIEDVRGGHAPSHAKEEAVTSEEEAQGGEAGAAKEAEGERSVKRARRITTASTSMSRASDKTRSAKSRSTGAQQSHAGSVPPSCRSGSEEEEMSSGEVQEEDAVGDDVTSSDEEGSKTARRGGEEDDASDEEAASKEEEEDEEEDAADEPEQDEVHCELGAIDDEVSQSAHEDCDSQQSPPKQKKPQPKAKQARAGAGASSSSDDPEVQRRTDASSDGGGSPPNAARRRSKSGSSSSDTEFRFVAPGKARKRRSAMKQRLSLSPSQSVHEASVGRVATSCSCSEDDSSSEEVEVQKAMRQSKPSRSDEEILECLHSPSSGSDGDEDGMVLISPCFKDSMVFQRHKDPVAFRAKAPKWRLSGSIRKDGQQPLNLKHAPAARFAKLADEAVREVMEQLKALKERAMLRRAGDTDHEMIADVLTRLDNRAAAKMRQQRAAAAAMEARLAS